MVADSFVVYGGGRWRALDTVSGDVSGWGRVQFLAARHGRLEVVPARRTLAALRSLAARCPSSAAHEGPQLEYRYPAELSRPVTVTQPPQNIKRKHCCPYDHGNNVAEKASIAVQCEPTLPRQQLSSKRRRDSTSSERHFHTRITTAAAVHMPSVPAKRPKMSISTKRNNTTLMSSDETMLGSQKSTKRTETMGPMKRKETTSSDSATRENAMNKISKYLQPRSKKRKQSDIKRTGRIITLRNSSSGSKTISQRSQQKPSSESGESSEWVNQNTMNMCNKQGPKPHQRKHHNISLVISSDSEAAPKPSKKNSNKKDCKTKSSKKPTGQPSGESRARDPPKRAQDQGGCMELVIDDRDVGILRLFLQKHCSNEELLRFDSDNNYKMVYFYRINPLVHVERCPVIAQMIETQEQMKLLQFASQLGLRSVSEASSVTRRSRTRTREQKSYVDTRDSNTDKENIEIPAKKLAIPTSRSSRDQHKMDTNHSGNVWDRLNTERPNTRADKSKVGNVHDHDRVQRNLNNQRMDKKINTNEKKDTIKHVVELSDDHESDNNAKIIKGNQKPTDDASQPVQTTKHKVEGNKPARREAKVLSTKLKRRALNVYSNLEDHAIVSWVSSGARASRVNGNRLWRELEEQYPRIVGRDRTWHSLRNRYLRYILPRLGALALSHAVQARLRAAAATGELKPRKREARRNSMFPLPPRGAASRPPRPAPPSPPSPHTLSEGSSGSRPKTINKKQTKAAPASPSPRYSDVTRRFAATRRRSTTPPPPRSGTRRSKRLASKSPSPRGSSSPAGPRGPSTNRVSADQSTQSPSPRPKLTHKSTPPPRGPPTQRVTRNKSFINKSSPSPARPIINGHKPAVKSEPRSTASDVSRPPRRLGRNVSVSSSESASPRLKSRRERTCKDGSRRFRSSSGESDEEPSDSGRRHAPSTTRHRTDGQLYRSPSKGARPAGGGRSRTRRLFNPTAGLP